MGHCLVLDGVYVEDWAKRVQVLEGRPFQLPPLCASCDGYSVHAGGVIGAQNRNVHPDRGWNSSVGPSRGRRWRRTGQRPCPVVGFGLRWNRADWSLWNGWCRWCRRLGRMKPPKARKRPASVGRRLTKRGRGQSRWGLWVGPRGVRRRGRGGAGCLKRVSRRAGSGLSWARRGVVLGFGGGAGGLIAGGWRTGGGRWMVESPQLGST